MIEKIKKETGDSLDILFKPIPYFLNKMYVIFTESLVDRSSINDFILEPLNEYLLAKKTKEPFDFIKTVLPVHKIIELHTLDQLLYNLLSGFTIILMEGEDKCLAIDTKAVLHSPISETKQEKVIKGPADGFTENYQVNIGLIRRRIKDPKLRVQECIVGKRGKTKIGIVYLEDVTKKELVNEIMTKIDQIEIDTILDSNYLIDLIDKNRNSIFNNYISTERPDNACLHIYNGRVAIVVENTPFILVIPGLFFDDFHSPEDYYQKSYNAFFTRIIRMIAFIVTVFVPAFYIAVTTYNQEAIPTNILISFATQRDGVPFPSSLEAIFLILIFEILRETDARTPTNLGSALSIVGSIVLGDAAVQAGLVSPIMVIVIAITSISGLILPFPDMSNGTRWWRIILLVFASLAGIFGLFIGSLVFIIELLSIESFGIPYLAPFSPMIKKGFGNIFLTSKKRKFWMRSPLFAPNNQKKGSELR